MGNSFFNSLLTVIFRLVIKLLRFISNIFLLPFTVILNIILPDLSSYTSMANDFVNNYILKSIACGREIFLNLTGFPQELITISVNVSLAVLGYVASIRVIAFVHNIWRTFKGG